MLFFFQFACKTDLMIRSWKCACPTKLLVYYWTRRYFKSSHQTCSLIKCVLKNFAKLKGKHLCQSLFCNKACNFIEKETLVQVYSCEFRDISENISRLLLYKCNFKITVLLIFCINVKMESRTIYCKIV